MSKTQPTNDEQSAEKRSRPWITLRDQGSLLALAASLLVLMGCYWLYRGGQRGELIQIDRASPLQARFQVDINRADWPEMIQLPGIGETLARRVIVERTENGPFLDLDELTRVNGIGLRTLERVRPYLLPIPKDTDWAAIESDNGQLVQ
jgi:competence protein ComEA